jgi:two-component system sensor histidine kinase RegB
MAELLRVLEIRMLLLAVCLGALLAGSYGLGLELPLDRLGVLVGGALALTALQRFYTARRNDQGPTDRDAQGNGIARALLLDVVLLTAILYLSGGWTNPLVSLYLVPIATAATLLPRPRAWLIAGTAIAGYTLLTRRFLPVFDLHHVDDDFALHVSGMWLTFVIAAALLAWFGSRFTETLRQRDRALANAREANLRNEQVIGIATLAAGTAHELATPLGTIAVIAAELESNADPALRDDVRELNRQVTVCREILARLREAAAPTVTARTCGEFLDEITDRFHVLRPAVALSRSLAEPDRARTIEVDPTLQQAVLNLLDNAANASPDDVELNGRIADTTLELEILDRGPGPAAAHGPSRGLGMGLVLANTTIERRGGHVLADARPAGGTCVRVMLPLTAPRETGA